MNATRHKRPAGRSLALLGVGLVGTYAAWRLTQRTRIEIRNQRLQRGKRILILGTGFGGREAALELAKQLPRPQDGEIMLVDQEPFLLFTPMLTEVAGGELDANHIASPVTQLPSRINFVQGRVEEIDLQSRRVTLVVGEAGKNIPQDRRTLTADHLVIALGSVTNFHNIPGLQEHSLTMKSLEDAASLRNRVLELLQRANEELDEQLRRELLTIVVGGAGLTGVETMAAINDLLRESVLKFPHLNARNLRTILIDPGKRILPELSENLALFAQQELERRHVEVRLNTKISAAGENYVELDDEERIATRTLVWAGGVTPNPIVKQLECAHSSHGAVIVNEYLAVPGRNGIWALGDAAQVPKPDRTGFYAPTAQNAVREGVAVARNVAAILRGTPPQPFRFKPLGELALVGRHAGVARILNYQFKGLTAWAMWRLIYWSKMPSVPQRMRVLSDWLLDLALGRNLAPVPPLPRSFRAVSIPETTLKATQ